MKKFMKVLKQLAKKHLNRPQLSSYNQIDSHNWASKMEMRHTLSGKSDIGFIDRPFERTY